MLIQTRKDRAIQRVHRRRSGHLHGQSHRACGLMHREADASIYDYYAWRIFLKRVNSPRWGILTCCAFTNIHTYAAIIAVSFARPPRAGPSLLWWWQCRFCGASCFPCSMRAVFERAASSSTDEAVLRWYCALCPMSKRYSGQRRNGWPQCTCRVHFIRSVW